jgi:DNA invertase Pin-like site-specific DNA recombinase
MLLGYARASLDRQPLDRQIDELTAAGVNPGNIYSENITGTKRNRPELNRLLGALQVGDTVVVVELTRLGRSTKDLLEIVETIHKKGAHFKSLNEAWLDTNSPWGQLIFTIFAALSQFERDLTSERTKSGLRAAAARGRMGGRPAKKTDIAAAVLSLFTEGVKIADIAEGAGVSRSTIDRILAEARAAGDVET